MELQVAAALKQPGEVFNSVMQLTVGAQNYGGRDIAFTRPVDTALAYSYDGDAFTLVGNITVSLHSRCARCNEAITEELSIPFQERFVKSLANDDEDCYTFDGETLDITKMVLDNIFLHLPMRTVCKKTCKGLCPVCGINLNNAQCACGCVSRERTTPLQELGRLLNDGKEV